MDVSRSLGSYTRLMPESRDIERPLMTRLAELGISTTTQRHPPVRTVEEAKRLRGELPGHHIKNLFLRDKKRNMWLVTVREDQPMDLKALRRRLSSKGNLSFGAAVLLEEHLGVNPGAVTPFAAMNDVEGNVQVVLDQALLTGDAIQAHPLHNEATTAISSDDLVRFLEATGHEPLILDLDDQ